MTSQAYERALAFLEDALAVLDEATLTPTDCGRPPQPAGTSGPSLDREHDRRGDRQGFRPW
jgi:hypothetical protein